MRRTYLSSWLVGTSFLLAALMLVSCSGDRDPAPFDAVLIELFGTSDTEAYLVEAERHAAELVAVCMNEAGFEFQIPDELAAESIVADGSTRTYAEQEGFGIITEFRRSISEIDGSASTLDPNRQYLTTLTAAEIQRFLVTLDGEPAEPGQQKTSRGCNGEASDVAYADWVRFFEALPNYTALGEERDTHPDWVAARLEWRDCMRERGFDYAEPEAIRRYVSSRMRTTVGEIYPDGQVPLVVVGDGFDIAPEVDELLSELTTFERDAAIANLDCTEPVADTFAAVEHEVQQAFVDRNQAAIDSLLQATS